MMSFINKALNGVGSLILLLAAFILFKAVGLFMMGTDVDGDGIGVYFLGMEINDRVPEAEIPTYATQFLKYGMITLVGALVMFIPSLLVRFRTKAQ
jgi:Fe2+ transport system protein B